MTRVGWQARISAAAPDGGAGGLLDSEIEDLVRYLLFEGEAPLVEPVEGVSTFSATFPRRGTRDRLGRSLRDFDLRTRLFRYPLSYTIYSAAFDALPEAARDRVYRRLYDVLRGIDRSVAFRHLTAEDRAAVFEILLATKPELPAYWRAAAPEASTPLLLLPSPPRSWRP